MSRDLGSVSNSATRVCITLDKSFQPLSRPLDIDHKIYGLSVAENMTFCLKNRIGLHS